MFPHGLTLQVTWPRGDASDLHTDGCDRVDPSPRDQEIHHVREKRDLSGARSDDSHDATRRDTTSVGSPSNMDYARSRSDRRLN